MKTLEETERVGLADGPELEALPALDAAARAALHAELERIRQVLDPAFSRNRHFKHFSSPVGRELLQFRKLTQGLLSDLEHTGPEEPLHYQLSSDGTRVQLELCLTRYRVTRRTTLTRMEFEALRVHPVLGSRLRARELAWEAEGVRR